MSKIKKTVITGVCISLCLILPYAIHTIPNAAVVFCPMHICVFACGMICGWQYGILCGGIGVCLSAFITGMPSMVSFPLMILELAVYGAVSGALMSMIKTGKLYADIYISLIVSMVTGRLVNGFASAFLFTSGKFQFMAWLTAKVVTGIPGIILQLILIPAIIITLMKAGVIPQKYQHTGKGIKENEDQ